MENEQQPVKVKKNLWKNPWVWIVIVLITLISFALMYFSRVNDKVAIQEESSDALQEITGDDLTAPESNVEADLPSGEAIDSATETEENEDPVASCVPGCINKECGNDGCGGSCGTCPDVNPCQNTTCTNGICSYQNKANQTPCDGGVCMNGACQICSPNCVSKECGNDGCGGSCGECHPTKTCIDYKCTIPILNM